MRKIVKEGMHFRDDVRREKELVARPRRCMVVVSGIGHLVNRKLRPRVSTSIWSIKTSRERRIKKCAMISSSSEKRFPIRN